MKPTLFFSLVFLFVLSGIQSSTYAQTYKYFQIRDVAHDCYLAAGASYDGHLYHLQKKDLGDNCQWRFEEADSGYYYIVDRRHGSAISSDYEYLIFIEKISGHVQSYSGKNCCQWRAEQATTLGAFWFKDLKYNLSIVGGDNYDGNIYLQVPGERRNAQWVLELVQDGDLGPDFYVTKQELLSLTLDTNLISHVEVAPLFSVDQVVSNNTSAEQSTSIEARKTETTTESWEFSKSITVSVAISVQSGVSVSGIAEVSSTVETTYEESYSWTTAVEISKETEYLWTIPVTVPPHSSVQVKAIIRKFTTQVPFTAIIRSTLADETTHTDTIDGIWNGVDYLTGQVSYEELTDIEESHLNPEQQQRLSIINNESSTFIKIFPGGEYKLYIYDLQGRSVSPVYSGVSNEPVEIRFKPDMKGVYFIRLITGNKEFTRKIVTSE